MHSSSSLSSVSLVGDEEVGLRVRLNTCFLIDLLNDVIFFINNSFFCLDSVNACVSFAT